MKKPLSSAVVQQWESLGPDDYLNYDERYWVLDIETDDVNATKIWVCVLRNVVSGSVRKFFDAPSFNEFVRTECPVLVGHNVIGFDGPTLNRLWGAQLDESLFVDTLCLGRLYFPNIPEGHGLGAWGKRVRIPKLEFNDFSKLTDEMVTYCVADTDVTRTVYRTLCKKMYDKGFSHLSMKIEHLTYLNTSRMTRNGIFFDIPAAVNLRNKLRTLQSELSEEIVRMFPPKRVLVRTSPIRKKIDGTYHKSTAHYLNLTDGSVAVNHEAQTYSIFTEQPFNIASPKQRIERLLELGWVPERTTKKGSPQVDEDALLEFSKKSGVREVGLIAEWLVLNGRANMIQTWLNSVNINDSRIHGYVNSCGAATRRMTHSSPNTANIPKASASVPYGFESRALWGPTPGLKQVGYDSAALEMRCFTHYLDNPDVTRLYLEGDPHQFNADLWGISRQRAKNVYYALIYGASDTKLATTAGHTGKNLAKIGREIRNAMLSRTPGLTELTELVQREYESGWIKTVDGGFVRAPESSHAVFNYKLQSCGAVIMKLSTCLIDVALSLSEIPAQKILDVHDEGQYEAPEEYTDLLGSICVDMHKLAGEILGLKTPLDGEYKVGNNWAETH